MDTFFEQIVAIKKNRKTMTLYMAIWLLALALVVLDFLLMPYLRSLFIIFLAGIVYGAFKLSSMLNIEYEYILTNGSFDIDKIVNKSVRKRAASFDLAIVSRLEKFALSQIENIDPKDVVYACNENDPEAYLMVYQKDGKKPVYVVFAPNEKMKNAIIKFLPKYLANSAFK